MGSKDLIDEDLPSTPVKDQRRNSSTIYSASKLEPQENERMKPGVPHGSEDGRTHRNRIQRRSARKVEFRALCAEVVAGMSASTRSYYGIAREMRP
jgi:hypothetical protein